MSNHRIIIGCGYVGRRLAHAEIQSGLRVSATVTRADKAQQLTRAGIICEQLDLDRTTKNIKLNCTNAVIHYHVPPPASGTVDQRMQAFLRLMDQQIPPERIVLISTTGVYGNTNGGWVTEDSPTNPQSDRAQRRLDAEQQLLAWCRQNQVTFVTLRVPGIYGPGRTPEARLVNPVVRSEESPYSNRIHVDDLVSACLQAAKIDAPYALYNVNDNQPSTMTDYFNAVADHADLPRPRTISLEQAKVQLSPAMLSYLSESRRVDNTRLREHLGVNLRFPDVASGLADCFKQKGATADGMG